MHGDKVVTMQLVGLIRFVSSDKYHSFGRNPWGIPNPANIPSTFFTSADRTRLSIVING